MKVIVTSKQETQRIGEAFAEGCNGELVTPSDIGDSGPVASYGWTHGADRALKLAATQGRDWYYIDNGYFQSRYYSDVPCYKVTRNALQHTGHGEARPEWYRLTEKLGVRIKPWRRNGRDIVLVLQSRPWYEFQGIGPRSVWTQNVCETIARFTDRPVVVRDKPSKDATPPPLEEQLADAWCVVSHSSNVLLEAVLLGIPAFCLGHGPGVVLGRTSFELIEDPYMPEDKERARCAAVLAANQWTVEEMRSGTCWQGLQAA